MSKLWQWLRGRHGEVIRAAPLDLERCYVCEERLEPVLSLRDANTGERLGMAHEHCLERLTPAVHGNTMATSRHEGPAAGQAPGA